MAFGIYVHIPYCLQRCPYCDFATYEMHETISPEVYTQLILKEIRQGSLSVGPREVSSIYFGGGTPSLIDPSYIVAVLKEFEKQGFVLAPQYEMTLEINPGTIDQHRVDRYREIGVNRYSVGAQTFDDALLKKIGRKHTAQETIKTLELLANNSLNFSLDILFALPHQQHELLQRDIEMALKFKPPHFSAYYLTVPDHHPLSKHRPLEDDQVEMFNWIENHLGDHGYLRYEISNYSLQGKESRHNWLYWSDQEYWGVGLSSHSFLKQSRWGTRFWNPPGMKSYEKVINQGNDLPLKKPYENLPSDNIEVLQTHQSLTDFCHTHLRTLKRGLTRQALAQKYPVSLMELLFSRLEKLTQKGLLIEEPLGWRMSSQGKVLADRVFEELTFLADEISNDFK